LRQQSWLCVRIWDVARLVKAAPGGTVTTDGPSDTEEADDKHRSGESAENHVERHATYLVRPAPPTR